MKYLIAMLATLLVPTCAVAAPLLPPAVETAINDRVQSGQYPALVIAVVDGERSQVRGFGKLDDGKAPDADSVFEIGSVTKTFTALLLAQSVLADTLKLDTPVATLLPDFRIASRDGKAITLEQLATHHAGLPRLPANLVPADNGNPYAGYDGAKLKAFLGQYSPPRDPGSSYEYSNLGYGLLGYALARHAGTTYDALLRTRIFTPLGMKASSAAADVTSDTQLAAGHDPDGKPVANWTFKAMAGAGAIRSSGADMLRYLKANMGATNTPLAAAMKLARTPRADGPGRNERIGLAWMTRHDDSGDVIWHNGMTGGYASFIGFTTDGKRGVVVLTNVQRSVDDLGFASLLADATLAPTHEAITLPAQELDTYAGNYQLAPDFILRIFRDGDQMYAQATGQGALPIFASAKDEFFAKAADIGISFQRDASGNIDRLVLHQNGDHTAPRLDAAKADAPGGHQTIDLDPSLLATYVGRYQLAPGAVFDVTLADGQLHARLSGQSAFPVYASAKDRFFYKVVDAQLRFERDADGKVVALVLHQNGIDQRAKRIGD